MPFFSYIPMRSNIIKKREKREERGHTRYTFEWKLNIIKSSSSSIITAPSRTDNARFMGLDLIPCSSEAQNLVKDCCERIRPLVERKITNKVVEAIGAILGDLIAAAEKESDRLSFRSVAVGEFTGEPIGYRPFKAAQEGLLRSELLHVVLGCYRGADLGIASRFRASDPLFELSLLHGILPAHWRRHFAYRARTARVREPVILRAAKVLKKGEEQGAKMTFDHSDHRVVAIRRQVETINAYFANVSIEGVDHRGFQRIFSLGDHPEFNWNMGGRLYSLGESYQMIAGDKRAASTFINGEATMEIDIKSSHLTIVRHHMGSAPRPGDLYAVPGVDRWVAKQWVTMSFGNGRLHAEWPSTATAKYKKEFNGGDLETDYPLADVRTAMEAALPEVGTALNTGWGWAKLQYIESCAIVDAVEELALRHDVPALPVHDSLIVPVSKVELAEQVLSSAFRFRTGATPALQRKEHKLFL
jgi:hypothetical protein